MTERFGENAFDPDGLGSRLNSALGLFEPAPAPVAAVVRKGKLMRMRRRAGIAAGIIAVGIAVAGTSAVLRSGERPAPIQPPPVQRVSNTRIEVQHLPPRAIAGVIAAGTIDGKPWRIILMRANGSQTCVPGKGGAVGDCRVYEDLAHAGLSSPTGGLGGGFGQAGSTVRWGLVSTGVTSVTLALSNGQTLDLRPVVVGGKRLVGVVLPDSVQPIRAVAYGQVGEVAYAVPFISKDSSSATFVTWLRPDQPGLRRETATIGTTTYHGRQVTMNGFAGPWGLCAVTSQGGRYSDSACYAFARTPISLTGGATNQTDHNVFITMGVAHAGLASLRLWMADGTSVRVPVATLAGRGLYLLVTSAAPNIAHWAGFDSNGHQVSSGTGSPA